MLERHAIAALLGTLIMLAATRAGADCDAEWFCIDEFRQGGNIELRARNLREFPITYTIRVRSNDLKINGPKTVTSTLAPNQSERIVMMSSSDSHRAGKYRYSFDWTVGDKNAVHDNDHIYSLPYQSGKATR